MKGLSTIAFAAVLVSGVAQAGPYSDAAAIEANCSSMGQVTATIYRGQMAGLTKETAIAMTIQQYGQNPTPMQKAPVIIAYDLAMDEEDAYRRAWAYCMDKHTEPKKKQSK